MTTAYKGYLITKLRVRDGEKPFAISKYDNGNQYHISWAADVEQAKRIIDADEAYSKALEASFGNQAGDARYDKRGESTLLLRDLKKAKQAADLAWHNAMRGNAYLAKR